MTFRSDRHLIARARVDMDAFAAFYERHEAPLLAFLRSATANSESAADLAAETFAALLDEVLDGTTIHEPRAWLYTVARRKLIDSVRRGIVDSRARQRLGMEPVALTDASLERIDEFGDPLSARAQAALRKLPKDQRLAVQARVIDELPYDEIATRLKCSEAVARKRVSRGLTRLKATLEEATP